MKCVLRPESGQPGTLQPSESHPEAIQVDGLSVPLKCARPNDPLMRRLAVSPCTAENATQKHRSPPSPFRQRQQLPFPCALGGRPALRLQPPPEILHPHPMLDRGGLLDAHLQLRQPLADLLYPHI